MPFNPEFPGYRDYRSSRAGIFLDAKHGANFSIEKEKQRISYIVSRYLHLSEKPELTHASLANRAKKETIFTPEVNGNEDSPSGVFTSNEFYLGLAKTIQGIGGVGIAVGPDQPLDFYVMGGLEEIYAVDLDKKTNLVTRMYLELGNRLHKILGDKYPTTDQFIDMFESYNTDILLSLLATTSSRYTFSIDELRDVSKILSENKIAEYLKNKRKFYKDATWIGDDTTLEKTITAYERGAVKVCHGDILGTILPKIEGELQDGGKEVSLIYTSNAISPFKDPLDKLKRLPLSADSKIVFSTYSGFVNLESSPRPYQSVIGWKFFIFPTSLQDWPEFSMQYQPGTPQDKLVATNVSEGCYLVSEM